MGFAQCGNTQENNIIYIYIYVTVYGKIGHNAACVDIAKRSIISS